MIYTLNKSIQCNFISHSQLPGYCLCHGTNVLSGCNKDGRSCCFKLQYETNMFVFTVITADSWWNHRSAFYHLMSHTYKFNNNNNVNTYMKICCWYSLSLQRNKWTCCFDSLLSYRLIMQRSDESNLQSHHISDASYSLSVFFFLYLFWLTATRQNDVTACMWSEGCELNRLRFLTHHMYPHNSPTQPHT